MNSVFRRLFCGLVAGTVAGVLLDGAADVALSTVPHVIFSAVLGMIFALWIGPRVRGDGSGLVWGEAFGLLSWLLGYLTLVPWVRGDGLYWTGDEILDRFELLVGQTIVYGAVLGLVFNWLNRIICHLTGDDPEPDRESVVGPQGQELLSASTRSMLFGGIGGLIGGWVFLIGVAQSDFFPLVAGLIRSDSMAVGGILHYLIAITIGVSFGLIFYREIAGVGSALVWGMTYGITWWMFGPMTLAPLLVGDPVDWSVAGATEGFTPLIAHILYGALIGLFFAGASRLWDIFFVDSDPLNRTFESNGSRSLRGVLMGQGAGVVGGLLFTIVMVSTDSLPEVASLIGGSSFAVGFLVHLLIAVIIGSSYGLFFHRAAFSYGSGLGWGLCYGYLWWLLGPGTLFFVLLREPVDWSLLATADRYPALVGHLLYGMGLGLSFQFLVRRNDSHGAAAAQNANPGEHHIHRTAGTPAAALWAVTLTIGVMVPLLLGVGF